jgi:hypothetical protein
MVQKSIEFRMNMQNVFDLADKVMSPEKAIDLAANLQVLGGAVGSLGDPFQMMYMATNNVEGLQDALIGAAESLAVYSEENGKFEITGVNLRRARAMADELGMSYQDLSNMAIAAAERTSAAADLMAAGISVDDKENYNLVDITRKEAKRLRIDVESRRKELKADALAFGALVDKEAKKYSIPLEDIEDLLAEKQKKIDDEKVRIKLEKEQEAKLPNRKLLLAEFENVPADQEIKVLSDLEFQGLIQKLVGERQAKIQAEQDAERQRLDQERRAQEAQLEAERARIQAEQDKLLEAERARQRELDKIEQDKRDAEKKIEELGKGYEIEVRPGGRTRCENFCLVRDHCDQWKLFNQGE